MAKWSSVIDIYYATVILIRNKIFSPGTTTWLQYVCEVPDIILNMLHHKNVVFNISLSAVDINMTLHKTPSFDSWEILENSSHFVNEPKTIFVMVVMETYNPKYRYGM
jgi:hypothetical protein